MSSFRYPLFNRGIFLITVVLVALGAVFAYSTSLGSDPARLNIPLRQWTYYLVGFVILIGFYLLNRRGLVILAQVLPLAAIVSLAMVLYSPWGLEVNNATRWLELGPFTFQPSELGKLAIILYLSLYVGFQADKFDRRPLRYVVPMTILGVMALLVVFEPDLSSAALLIALAGIIFFLGRIPMKHVMVAVLVFAAGLPVLGGLKPYQMERIKNFVANGSSIETTDYHVKQSLIAVGSGGVTGSGLGYGASKLGYLPEHRTDFIFSVVAEESGFVGAAAVLLLFLLLFRSAMVTGQQSEDTFSRLVCFGIGAHFAIQVMIHVAVGLGVFPVTGIVLPFISQGGTALFVAMAEIGILMNISRENKMREIYESDASGAFFA